MKPRKAAALLTHCAVQLTASRNVFVNDPDRERMVHGIIRQVLPYLDPIDAPLMSLAAAARRVIDDGSDPWILFPALREVSIARIADLQDAGAEA